MHIELCLKHGILNTTLRDKQIICLEYPLKCRVQPYEVYLHMLPNFPSIYAVVQYKHDCLSKRF